MMTARIVHALIVLTLLPALTLRGRSLRRYAAFDVATYAFAAIVWPFVHRFDSYLAAVAFVVVKIAIFSYVLATAGDVRWSANRACAVALLVYSLLVPGMQRTPPDGDEPFYLLVTESIVRDFDLDLRNQYANLERSETNRPDLQPQPGDPVGANGEQYSRHEPFLSLLLIPGYLLAGLGGALATMAVFGALLVRSTMRLFEEEGIDDATARTVFPFFAFGPPVIFYAARIWPEVPAALCFVEAIRGVRQRRAGRWVPAVLALALLKLRFLLVVAPLVIKAVTRSRKHAITAGAIVAIPLLVAWLITGSATSVHSLRDLVAPSAGGPLHGLFGLILDGAAGLAFQAPFYLLGIFALTRWREMPAGFRLGCLASMFYVLLLIPRSEWHGGWAPPLRYIVFLMPVLALGAAALRTSAPGVIALFTAGLVIHGVTYPWRLFHIANGESVAGEALSALYASDFSRLFPSFIRLNTAAIVASIAVIVALIVLRFVKVPAPVVVAGSALLLAAGFVAGQQPGAVIHLEDAHVSRSGGELHPPLYTVARFAYRGGWILHAGQSVTFLARSGPADLHYASGADSVIQIGEVRYTLPAASDGYRVMRVEIPASGRVTLTCVRGSVNLDRLDG